MAKQTHIAKTRVKMKIENIKIKLIQNIKTIIVFQLYYYIQLYCNKITPWLL